MVAIYESGLQDYKTKQNKANYFINKIHQLTPGLNWTTVTINVQVETVSK